MESTTHTEPKGWLTATITRADGTREELGVIASTDAGTMTITEKPTIIGRIKTALKERCNG